MDSYLLRGVFMGLALGAPIGGVGALCIRRALNKTPLSGFISQMGAATIDACYGLIAVFSITVISNSLLYAETYLSLIGGIILIYLGIRTIFKKRIHVNEEKTSGGLLKDYISTVLLTITNPTTILTFVAFFNSIQVDEHVQNYIDSCLVILGVFLGSIFWGGVIWVSAKVAHKFLSDRNIIFLSRVVGCIMLVFGLWSISKFVLLA